jgi:hypothetical protein
MDNESRGCNECNAEDYCEIWQALKVKLEDKSTDMRLVLEDMFEHFLGVRPFVKMVDPDSDEGREMKARVEDNQKDVNNPKVVPPSNIVKNRAIGEQMRKDWDDMTEGNPYGHD